MNYFLLDFFTKLTSTYLIGNFYIGILLEKKYNKYVTGFAYMLMSYFYYYLVEPLLVVFGDIFDIMRLITVVGFHILFPFIFSNDKAKKNIMNCILFILTLIIYESILGSIFYMLEGHLPNHMIDNTTTFVWNLIFNATFYLSSTIMLICIQLKRKQIEDKSVFFIIIMPFVQVLLFVVLFLSNIEIVDSWLIFFGQMVLIIFILTDYLTYAIIERNLNNYELKSELKMFKLKSQNNYSYYELATSKFDEMATIKHDINNQLQSIYALIDCEEENHKEISKSMLKDLGDNISAISNIKYCNNPIVNTILVLKSQTAKDKNIQTNIQMGGIKELNIKEIDLCSIFSNLYDNAIEACDKTSENNKYIEIKSDKKGGYFILKFANSNYENLKYNKKNQIITSKNDKKNHGYGLKSVSDIVKNYNGKMNIKNEDNIFEICIMIPQG